jgi:hypothetical protein
MPGKRQTWSLDSKPSVKKWGESTGRDGAMGYDGSRRSPHALQSPPSRPTPSTVICWSS